MTPKKKAKELFDKYAELSGVFVGDYESEKEMCLIAVDEILNALDSKKIIYGSEYQFEENRYWEQVKQEIENL